MRPEEPQQTAAQTVAGAAEPTEWLAVLTSPVFGGASVAQLLLLLAIGTVWSGLLWLAVDRVKDGVGLRKPYTQRQRLVLTFAPLGASVVLCLGAFPAALELAGIAYEMTPRLHALSVSCGVAAWVAAKVSHDFWGEILTAARKAVVNRIRGLGGPKIPPTADHPALAEDSDA